MKAVNMKSETLKVTGMSGGACVSLVTSALEAVTGVKHVSVSLMPNEATVQFDEDIASTQQLQDALSRYGYGVAPAKAAECNGEIGRAHV